MHESENRVFYLQFHVDYWDYIGWKDPYSFKEATARQKEFIMLSGAKSTYTPQVAVNGCESNGNNLRNEIAKGLRTDATIKVGISAVLSGKNKLSEKYELNGIKEPSRFLVCLVERGLVTDCKNSIEIILPADLDVTDSFILAYTADENWRVSGGTTISHAKELHKLYRTIR